jgi:DNA-binding NarL/FixJ family response regulator
MTTSLAVVDAAQVVRVGIREIVSTTDTIQLAGEWSNLQEFDDFLKKHSVDVVLLGDNVTRKSLKHTYQQLLEQQPKLKVIILAASFTTDLIDELSTAGVIGFICKDEELAGFLVNAVQYAKRGETFISPKIASTLILTTSDPSEVALNPRQMQVLNYMAEYLTPQEIASKMGVSVSSVYNLQQRLRLALGVKTSGQILTEAAKRGLIGKREQKWSA